MSWILSVAVAVTSSAVTSSAVTSSLVTDARTPLYTGDTGTDCIHKYVTICNTSRYIGMCPNSSVKVSTPDSGTIKNECTAYNCTSSTSAWYTVRVCIQTITRYMYTQTPHAANNYDYSAVEYHHAAVRFAWLWTAKNVPALEKQS